MQKNSYLFAAERDAIVVIEGDILIDTNDLIKMQKMNEDRQKRAGNEMLPMHFVNEGDDKNEAGNDRNWPNCRIPYKFDQSLRKLHKGIASYLIITTLPPPPLPLHFYTAPDMRAAFVNGMKMWEGDTCLNFERADDEDTDFLYLQQGDA